MTGYGTGQGQIDSLNCAVEIRSVNNRYFRSRIKLPDAFGFLEDEIETLLHKQLGRGAVTYTLKIEGPLANGALGVDKEALKMILDQVDELADNVGSKKTFDISNLLLLPGIVNPVEPDEQRIEQIKSVVTKISQQALQSLRQMRQAEGQALAEDLKKSCRAISDELEKIAQRRETVLEEYVDRLTSRIEELLSRAKLQLDEVTLTKEIAVYAERSDIAEELSRLKSHLNQFVQSCQADEQAGRRLDFISQEMLREANTIASKSSDYDISNWVVNIKCHIDRIKEQVQNVL